VTKMVHKVRGKQRPRNREAERRGRRYKRQQELARRDGLPDPIRSTLLMRGLARPVSSVRGQLLSAILGGAVQRGGIWVFDWSIRDLAHGGLADGRVRRDPHYLLQCLAEFIDAGILRKIEGRRGRPVVYEVIVDAGQTASRDAQSNIR
jgi:hypothetical protein